MEFSGPSASAIEIYCSLHSNIAVCSCLSGIHIGRPPHPPTYALPTKMFPNQTEINSNSYKHHQNASESVTHTDWMNPFTPPALPR